MKVKIQVILCEDSKCGMHLILEQALGTLTQKMNVKQEATVFLPFLAVVYLYSF